MASFRDCMQKDLEEVFFNFEEFAEIHVIDGKEILLIIDEDELQEREIKSAEGTYSADLLFHVKASDLPGRLKVGAHIDLDNKNYEVVDVKASSGVYTIAVEANRA